METACLVKMSLLNTYVQSKYGLRLIITGYDPFTYLLRQEDISQLDIINI